MTKPPEQTPGNTSDCYPVSGVSRFQRDHKTANRDRDLLSIEEPLAIILRQENKQDFPLAVTMRTPGEDRLLASGFLFSEGIIRSSSDIVEITADQEASNPENTLIITLKKNVEVEQARLERHFFTNSACGVCGKTSIQALELLHQPQLNNASPVIDPQQLYGLPLKLKQQQQQFSKTGSVHSAALFSPAGNLLCVQEDIGRHNAMDKLLGNLLAKGNLSTAKNALLLVSGRASFELVQKALMADIAILAAIGAPSSLALQLAERHQMTLIGFLKEHSFNVYTGSERINS